MIFWTRMHSPVGQLTLVEEDGTLIKISMSGEALTDEEVQSALEQVDVDTYHQDSPFLNKVQAQLSEYFEGTRKEFALPYNFTRGTDFQRQVWDIISTIPFGQSLTYGEIAIQLNNPNAARAIGGACGNNPVPIVVPCHRVLAADGQLGGFSGGKEKKRTLLDLENIPFEG